MEVPREHFAGTHRRMSKDLMPNIRNRDQRQRELIAPALTHRQSVVDNVNTSAPTSSPSDERTGAGSSATTSTRAFATAWSAMRGGAAGNESPTAPSTSRRNGSRSRPTRKASTEFTLPVPPRRQSSTGCSTPDLKQAPSAEDRIPGSHERLQIFPETVASVAGGTRSRMIGPVRDSPGELPASGA